MIERIHEYSRTGAREEIGKVLRRAFPLGLGSFAGFSGLVENLEPTERLDAMGFIAPEQMRGC